MALATITIKIEYDPKKHGKPADWAYLWCLSHLLIHTNEKGLIVREWLVDSGTTHNERDWAPDDDMWA